MFTRSGIKYVLCLSFYFLFHSTHIAFSLGFKVGDNIFAFGYGFGTFAQALAATYDEYYDYDFTVTGPLFARYEYAITDHMGVGINFAYAEWVYKYQYDSYNSSNSIVIGKDYYTTYSILGRFNLHFGNSEKFDPFWGVATGYRKGTLKKDNNNHYNNGSDDFVIPFPLGLETTIGARYYFSKNVGIYIETGLAKAIFQTGISIKF